MFLCYFQAIFAIIVFYIYRYNCVYMLVFICQVSFYFTSIIVYNCAFEFQTICQSILPIYIYNLSKMICLTFLPIYIYNFSKMIYHIFLPIYIQLYYHYSIQFIQYIAILYSILYSILYIGVLYSVYFSTLYSLFSLQYNCITSLFFFCLPPEEKIG